jgi:Ca2+-binding RTX toxin-like protein
LCIEALEQRALLTASAIFDNGLLTVTGDNGANLVSIFSQVESGTPYVMVQDDGVTILDGRPSAANVAASAVQSIAVNGGDGDDVLYLQAVSAASGFSAIASVSLSGGAGSDTIIGSAFASSIFGGDGADVLVGGAGDDTVAGGAGDDVYLFDPVDNGSDTLSELADEGRDWLTFGDAENPLVLCLSTSDPQFWGGGTLTLADPAQFENVVGTAFDDFLCGNQATNFLVGGDGNDTLVGDGGADFLVGDLGDDALVGADGADVLLGAAGADNLTGDLGDDLLIAADLQLPVVIESLEDFADVADPIMAVWTANDTIAQRIANLMGAAGATNPLPSNLQFRPGETLIEDEAADVLVPLAGYDAVFLDIPTDIAMKSADATYIQVDPDVPLLEAQFAAGVLTVSFRGAGDVVYSVADGNLLVNGQHVLGSPLPVGDVDQVVTQLGKLAGDLDDAALFTGELPNLEAAAYTRSRPSAPPLFSAASIDSRLQLAVGEGWQALTSYSAQDIAAAANVGNFALYWAVVSAGALAASQSSLQSSAWYEIADGLAVASLAILAEAESGGSGMMSAAGGEGGTLDIRSAGNVDEDSTAVFPIEFNAESFDGGSVDWRTQNGSAIGGTDFCNGDYESTLQGRLTWLDGQEGDGAIQVPTFSDYRMEGDESFSVQLSNLQNADGAEGGMSLGNSSASATIVDQSILPQAFVGPSQAVEEGGVLRVPVSLSHPTQDPLTVNWSARDISTEGNQDYSPLSGALTFAALTCQNPGETLKYIDIQTVDDPTDEYDEELQILLTGGTNVQLPQGEETPYHTIVDNDPPPILSVVDVTVAEGAAATFTLSLSAASELPISIRYYTVNGSALAPTDYNAIASTTITLDPGTPSRTVSVQTINDTIPEPTQYFWLFVTDGVNVRFPYDDFRVIAKGDITDNDPLRAQVVSVSFGDPPNPAAGTGNITIEHDPLPVAGQIDGPTTSGTVYAGQHYLDLNHNGSTQDAGDQQYPIAYARSSVPTLQVTIWAEYNEFVQPFSIKGVGDWNITLNPTTASKTGSMEGNGSILLSATITSSSALPAEVKYKELLAVNWEVKAGDDAAWRSAGASRNQAYLTYAMPTIGPVYHTVIHIGSTKADGAAGRDATVAGAWNGFSKDDKPANTTRVDGAPLRYWNTFLPNCQSTAQLLAYQDGRCGAWARFFYDVLAVQGIRRDLIDIIAVTPDKAALAALGIGTATGSNAIDGFLVKSWSPKPGVPAGGPFLLVARWSAAQGGWTIFADDFRSYQFYDPLTTLTDDNGIAGQNRPDPASLFPNHGIVAYTQENRAVAYYDPSYGLIRADEMAFDNNAIFGYFEDTDVTVTVNETQTGDLNGDGVFNQALDVPAIRVFVNPSGDQINFNVFPY